MKTKVFLKDGQVLMYNTTENVIEDGHYTIIKSAANTWLAQIATDLIERIERIDAVSPCSIKRRKNKLAK